MVDLYADGEGTLSPFPAIWLRIGCFYDEGDHAMVRVEVHDVCSLTMHFEPKCMATVTVSWLDPNKIRCMTIVGDRKMAVFDDNEPLEKMRVYNKCVEVAPYADSFAEFQWSFRYGDTCAPSH